MPHHSPQLLGASQGRSSGSLDIEPQGATRIMDFPKPAADVDASERGATRIMDAPRSQGDILESPRFARGKTLVMSWPVAQVAHVDPPAPNVDGALVPEATPTPVGSLVAEPRSTRQETGFLRLDEGNPTRIVSPAEWLSQPLEAARTSADSGAPAAPPENPATRMKPSPLWSREAAWFKAQSLTRRVSIGLFPLAICSAVIVFHDAPPTPTPTTMRRAAAAPAASPAPVAPKPDQSSTAQVVVAPEPVTAPSLPAGVQRSLRRQAADALAEGNYAVASSLYQSLVESEPNNVTYRAAVRLLDRRLTKRGPGNRH